MKQLLVTLAATLLVAGVVFVVLSPGTPNFADQIETQSTELDRIKVTYRSKSPTFARCIHICFSLMLAVSLSHSLAAH